MDDGRIEGIPENCSLELEVATGSGDKSSINYIQGQLVGERQVSLGSGEQFGASSH